MTAMATATGAATWPGLPPVEVSWRMPRVFMLRTAALPIEVADELACDATAAWAARVLDLEDTLRRTGQELSDALAVVIGRCGADDPLRQRLIRLRRDVYNVRAPRPPDPDQWPPEQLGPNAHAQLREWLATWSTYQSERSLGGQLLDRELTDRRARLRQLADHPDLRGGIQLASPSLDRYLSTYLQEVSARGKRARRVERSLLEYTYRTAGKTSPFSRLTTVDLGSFTSGTDEVLRVDPAPGSGGARHASRARLNLAALGRLSTIMLADETLRADLPVTATTGWRIDHGRVRYLRRRRIGSEDGDAAVTMESIHESLFVLPSGRLIEEILAALPDGRVLRFADLVTVLSTEDRPAAEVAQYLHHLLRVGLLVVPNLQLDIHASDPVDGFRAALAAVGTDWAGRLAGRVAVANQLASQYPDEDLAGRRATVSQVRDEFSAAHADLGRPDVPAPRTLLYEDVTLPSGTRVTADRERWERDILPDLRALARIMPLFDVNLPRRLVTRGFFLARYGVGGQCPDLLTFAHEFQQDFFEQYSSRMLRRRPFDEDNQYVRQENWFRQEEIDALDDARVDLAGRINEAYHALPEGATELVLDDTFLDEVAATIPANLGALDPRSFFLQIADDGGDPLVVVNRVYSGMTLLFSRFAYLFGYADLAGTLREELTRLHPTGAVLAELKGGYDATNLNLHPSVTPYELVCPGEVSFRPPDEQIHMDDLLIEHDPATDRVVLRSRRLDAEVIPVYLGFLLPMALPEVQQVLLNFGYVGMAQLDLWAGTTVPLPDRTIATYPRIRQGNVVLQRRMWKLHPDYLPPARTPDQPAEAWFLSWARWRRDNNLPRRVFATPDGSRLTSAADEETRDRGAGGQPDHKPLYVDFDSYFSVELLDTMARQTNSRVVLTEMLPGRDQQMVHGADGSHVTELTVELNGIRTRGGERD